VTDLAASHTPEAIQARLAAEPNASYLRDWVYGGLDGAITLLAVVAGVAGAGLSTEIIFVLGLGNLVADGFAMAAGNYSATRTERDEYPHLLAEERRHIAEIPEGEREEIRQIFAAKGFAGGALDEIVATITANEADWARTMMMEEHGRTPPLKSPLMAGGVTFLAFVLSGLVPLVSYLTSASFPVSIAATGASCFAIGAARSRWSLRRWWHAGTETLLIGLAAAALAFAIGWGLASLDLSPRR
jgi:VIT1/CCC1 family predicted Fe2+/Mn2+ transporter